MRRGVTLFDTADVYGLGCSERLLGRLLCTVDRSSVVVSSKVGYFAGTGPHPYHPAQIRHQFATTRRNLNTDYLDVYFLHSSDFGAGDRYLSGAVAIMNELRRRGQVRAIGMRAPHSFAEEWAGGDGPHATQAARFLHLFSPIRPDVVTARYDLLSPRYAEGETDIFVLARRHGTGVLIKQALGQGLLLDSHVLATPPRFSSGDHRTTDPQFRPEALRILRGMMIPIRSRFGDSPTELARVALRYALQHAPEAAVLVGFRNADQIHTTLTCLGDPLLPEEITWICADVEAVRRLLEALDFTPLVTVDKTREEWKLPDVEIVFDHVQGAGCFVEFEFKGDAENVSDATARLEEFLASLNVDLGEPVNRGYPHILLGREY